MERKSLGFIIISLDEGSLWMGGRRFLMKSGSGKDLLKATKFTDVFYAQEQVKMLIGRSKTYQKKVLPHVYELFDDLTIEFRS